MRRFELAVVVALAIMIAPVPYSVALAQGGPPVSLEQSFNAQYPIGTLVVVRINGLVGVNTDCSQPNTFTFKEGQLRAPGFLQKLTLGRAAGPCTARPFAAGAKAMVVASAMVVTASVILIRVVQCDGCDAQERDQRLSAAANGTVFRAEVLFQFPKSFLVSAAAAPVQEVIDHVFSFDAGPTSEGTAAGVKTGIAGAPPPPKLGPAYVNSQNKDDSITLNANGSFGLHEGGQAYTGTYLITGTILRLHIVELQKDVDIAIRGDQLIVNGEEIWVRFHQ